MKKIIALVLALVLTAALFAGCSAPKKTALIATPSPHAEILELIAEDMKKLGYELDITVVTDYVTENPAVAGGDALFAPHLGDPIATSSGGVAWSLALGYQLFASLWTVQMFDAEYMAWLGFLSDLQRWVAAYCMGTAPTGFRYLSGSGNTGVIEARYGPMRVVANLSAGPYRLGGGIVIAPKGFYAVSPEARAGYLLRYGRERYDTPRYLIDHRDTGLKIYELAR